MKLPISAAKGYVGSQGGYVDPLVPPGDPVAAGDAHVIFQCSIWPGRIMRRICDSSLVGDDRASGIGIVHMRQSRMLAMHSTLSALYPNSMDPERQTDS